MLNTSKINLTSILLTVLVITVLIQSQCGGEEQPKNTTTTIVKVETKWDTVKINTVEYVPYKNTVIKTVYETIPADVDTLTILQEYFNKVVYTDTIQIDTFGSITLIDTISKNAILSRRILSDIRIPTTTITAETVKNKVEVYTGINVAGNKQYLNQIGFNALIRSKKSRVYGIGVAINRDMQPIITGSYYWKINFKKPKLKVKLL